ncbi:MAG: hypothetical protein ACRDCE_20720 [Cetobacterium sp.]|uniref:hypothetical protein n=1 Tax=Cetobacterium sp. TaxID=2071632 RepID=UPI003EE6C93F
MEKKKEKNIKKFEEVADGFYPSSNHFFDDIDFKNLKPFGESLTIELSRTDELFAELLCDDYINSTTIENDKDSSDE